MFFSVVLIGRNEEKTLPKLLGSLKEFREKGGEIILVDTGSSDKTADVARSYGCKVEEVGDRFRYTVTEEEAKNIADKFINSDDAEIVKAGDTLFDYASARNYAATLASNDIIATPDCDEAYSKFDIDEVNRLIDAENVDQFEYNFVFSHDAQGNELIKFMHSKFYNRTKLQWEGIIHEVLKNKPGVTVNRKFVDESIIKLEHWQNMETNRGHYLTGLALSVLRDEDNDRNAHYFARELMYSGRNKSAIALFEKHIAMGRWPAERAQSQLHVGDCYLRMGDSRKAVHSWIDSFDTASNRREPLMRIAEYYRSAGSPDHVISYIAAALQIQGDNFYANFQPYYENIPHELMYWALWEKGELNESRKHFDICLGYQPLNPKYLFDYKNYYELPKVSIIIPTLRSEDALIRTTDSIKKLSYDPEKIEVIVLKDEPRIGVPKRLAEGVEKATGDWIVYAADDMEFTPDSLMIAYKTAIDNKKLFMAFNSGEVSPDGGNICEHFMIHKSLLSKINGQIFDTDFNHVGVDNLLWAQMKRLGQAMRSDGAVVIHHHFSKTGVMDEVHKIAWDEEKVSYDRELLEQKLEKLAAAPLCL